MAGTELTYREFERRGFNRIAFVARDMAETVAWYEDVLGMKLFANSLSGGHEADYDANEDDGDVFIRSL